MMDVKDLLEILLNYPIKFDDFASFEAARPDLVNELHTVNVQRCGNDLADETLCYYRQNPDSWRIALWERGFEQDIVVLAPANWHVLRSNVFTFRIPNCNEDSHTSEGRHWADSEMFDSETTAVEFLMRKSVNFDHKSLATYDQMEDCGPGTLVLSNGFYVVENFEELDEETAFLRMINHRVDGTESDVHVAHNRNGDLFFKGNIVWGNSSIHESSQVSGDPVFFWDIPNGTLVVSLDDD